MRLREKQDGKTGGKLAITHSEVQLTAPFNLFIDVPNMKKYKVFQTQRKEKKKEKEHVHLLIILFLF